jgi:hypothetical protein
MSDGRLVVVPCGTAKLWANNPHAGPTPARAAYVSPYFRNNLHYAETFGDACCILSAKYGFIAPDFVIPEAYEVTFKRKATKPITPAQLADQVRHQHLERFALVEVLAGSDYASSVRAAFRHSSVRISCPLEGFRLGEGWQRVNRALAAGRPLSV